MTLRDMFTFEELTLAEVLTLGAISLVLIFVILPEKEVTISATDIVSTEQFDEYPLIAWKDVDKKGDIVKSQEDDKSHFDPNYFGKGTWWQLPDLDYSERAYALARTAFESEGRQILDATLGGQLEVFPKITLREARELCGCEA